MAEHVRWGILSTAHINHRIIPAIRESEYGKLMAIASRDENLAMEHASEWDIPQAFGSYDELLNDPEIDVVYNPLPNDLHAEWTIKALRSGKHVLCEKPLCLSMEELNHIAEATFESGKTCSEAFMYLHHPQTELFRSMIEAGELGEPRSLKSSFCFQLQREAQNYRLSTTQGGGALWDVGVYPISFFQYMMGSEPDEVHGFNHSGEPLDMSFSGMMKYPSGAVGQFFCSFESAYSTTTVLTGSRGKLTISHPFINTDACSAVFEKDGTEERLDIPRTSLYLGQIEDMHEVVRYGARPRISLENSRGHVRTVLRLRKSAGL